MGIDERKERERRRLRRSILNAALDVFANEGYRSLSMRKLAKKIEYSPTTIYLHFKDKDELFEGICERTFEQLSLIFSQIVSSAPTPLDGLQRCCRAYVDFGLQHREEYTVAFLLDSGQRLAPEEVRKRFPKAMQAFYQLRTGVADCMEKGELAPDDSEVVSQLIWAGLHGITALLIVKPSFPWRDQNTLIDRMILALINAMRPEAVTRCAGEDRTANPVRDLVPS